MNTVTYEAGNATIYDSAEAMAQFGRAMRATGREVALVPLGTGLHAGHIALIRAAKRMRGMTVVVAWAGVEVPEAFSEEGVDAVWTYSPDTLWPRGLRTRVEPKDALLEDHDRLASTLSAQITMINVVQPSYIVVGEKDYEVMLNLQHAITDLHLPLKIRGVPTVRTADGLALSLRNVELGEATDSEAALAISAALVAGAHAAERGSQAVVEAAQQVLQAAQVEPEYVELRGLDLRHSPEEGDARLFIAAEINGVRLTDNVGLVLGQLPAEG